MVPGGYSVWKRVPTAVQPLRSGGCRDPRLLKRGAVLLLYCIIGELSEYLHLIFHIKIQLYALKYVLETLQNNNLVKYDTCNTENSPLNVDFKRLCLVIHEKRGL